MASERHDTAASAATAAGPDAAAVAPPSPSIPSRRPSTSGSRISRTVSFDQDNLDAIQHTSSHPQPPVHRPSANTNDRISNILEDARNRSETMSSPEQRRILESDRHTSSAGAIVQDVRAEMDAKQASLKKARTGRDRRAIYADLKDLRKEYRERERGCLRELVGGSKVVLATLHGAGGFQLRDEKFDVVIIDEASQALEAQCWVPLLRANKVVCAGDHLQLPPTIKSLNSKTNMPKKQDEEEVPTVKGMTLETTLFDRLLSLHGPSIKRMLTTQYRMHEAIMRFPSDELYEGRLVAAESVATRLLKDMPYEVQDTEDTNEPLVFIDTQGGDFPEKSEEDNDDAAKKARFSLNGESKSNEMEAAVVRQHARQLVEAGIKPEDIAVVTPYNAQLALLAPLKEELPGIELGSVDGFQGREKEAVIVSLVRSNGDGEVGFLAEKRRLNVAMTRPKRSLTVIGDSETVKRGSAFLRRWIEFLEENADLRYPDVSVLQEA
ncbi:hypothetical protein BN1723_004260 [Verticillium longisporum]|uniref:DNA2/NAM7 helicase-like C-terminal domain-containing protein n=1 Tax=Verticillium longisporum TaxID=100787 RepID=A0A0G4MSN6_VERLO|nr:hypothetical protein BN1723_004260 [Verticillium longisporum]